MTTDIIDRPEDASKGGFQAIKRVEGILQPLKRVASRFESGWGNKPPSDQVEIVLASSMPATQNPLTKKVFLLGLSLPGGA